MERSEKQGPETVSLCTGDSGCGARLLLVCPALYCCFPAGLPPARLSHPLLRLDPESLLKEEEMGDAQGAGFPTFKTPTKPSR